MKLNSKLCPWTGNHSRSGRWNAYRSNDNKVYQFRNNLETMNKMRSRTGNGTLYSDMSALVVKDKAAKQICGPDVSWDMSIQSQLVWVGTLLQDVHFFSDDGYSNLWEIVHKLEEHGYLLAVSDGSVKFHDMSFGWILATPNGKRLAAAAGPCNRRGNSLRAEGAGMLSVTMFIALIKHYLEIEIMKIVFISDNSELIRRLKVHKQYDEPYPNETLKSEFDVTEQIYRTTKT
jgi:hypothetical protein